MRPFGIGAFAAEIEFAYPTRIAAAMMKAKKSNARTSLSFQNASAAKTIPPTTSVASAALRGFFHHQAVTTRFASR